MAMSIRTSFFIEVFGTAAQREFGRNPAHYFTTRRGSAIYSNLMREADRQVAGGPVLGASHQAEGRHVADHRGRAGKLPDGTQCGVAQLLGAVRSIGVKPLFHAI